MTADLEHIRRAGGVLLELGATYELRMLHTRQGTISGYYTDFSKLAEDAARWSGRASGVYITLNPVNPALLARSANRLTEYAKQTTSDNDIVKRRWLPLDFDAVRPAGISSTDAEHAATIQRARDAGQWLRDRGWPEHALGDSANGGHLLCRVDLPNTAMARGLVERCLKALAFWWADEVVTIDQSTFNAARIWKLYGTLAMKGDHLSERPHRLARILETPELIEPVPMALLEALAALAPAPQASGHHGNGHSAVDIQAWLEAHGLKVSKVKPWQGGTLYELAVCPWNAEHRGSARVIQFSTGALSAACFHNSCAAYRWRDLREMIGESRRSANGCGHAKQEVKFADEDDAAEPEPGALTFPDVAWRGIFAAYRDALQRVSETADALHFAGLWTVAAVRLRRRISFYYGMLLYPNVFLLTFAPSGETKTAGQRHALGLLPSDGSVRVLKSVGSAEGLQDWLAQSEDGSKRSHLLALEEFATLLARGRWDGSTLIPFLTEAFDCPELYEVPFRRQPIKLTEPTVSIIAATTPDWFWRWMREVDIQGGFGNRFLMLTGSPKAPVSIPDKPDVALMQCVQEGLDGLAHHQVGELRLTQEARAIWDRFYTIWRAEPLLDPLTKAATMRIPAYILKLSMVYSALEKTAPSITPEQLAAAIAVGNYAKHCARLLMGQHLTQSEEGRIEDLVRRALRERKHTRRSLKNRLGGRVRASLFNKVLDAMIRTGEVLAQAGQRQDQMILSLAGQAYDAIGLSL